MCIFSFECFRLEAKAAGPQASLTFLVANDSLGKVVFAHVVLQKGADPDHHSVDALVSIIMRLGYAQLALRSDNVPAILLLCWHAVTASKANKLEQIVQEHPNTYKPAGNVEVEATVKQVTGILRTNDLNLGTYIQKEIPLDHPVTIWLVEYSAWMINGRRRRRACPTAAGSQAVPAVLGVGKRPPPDQRPRACATRSLGCPCCRGRHAGIRRLVPLALGLAASCQTGPADALYDEAPAFAGVERQYIGEHRRHEKGPPRGLRGAALVPCRSCAGTARKRTWTQCAWQAREAPGA